MSTFLEDEESAEASRPREGIEFILPAVTYRVATGTRNLIIDGRTFHAEPSARGEVGISASGDPRALIVTLPMSHAVCRRYMAGGVPPRQILVNVWRQQAVSGLTELVWSGYVTSLAPDGHVGNFHVPSRSSDTFQRRLPTVTTGKACPHVLYDSNCKMLRVDFAVEAVVATFSGRVVTVVSLFGDPPDGWAEFGELEHIGSGERMTIQTQVGRVITMQLPILEMRVGDHVMVSPGCDHLVESGCRDKFDNVVNFGGFPELQTVNPFIGKGIWVSIS